MVSYSKVIGFRILMKLFHWHRRLQNVFYGFCSIGWNIAITPNGYELVEVNCPGGHDFLQAFGKPFGDVMRYKLN